nr:hypothetical protein [Streptomyces sp. CB03234]
MFPGSAESVPQPVDPPIYQALVRHWASSGRTVPGRRDQEWIRLTAAPAWTFPGAISGETPGQIPGQFGGQISGSRGPRFDGR